MQKEADRKFAEQTKAAEDVEKTARALKEQSEKAAKRVAAIDKERKELASVLAEKHGVTTNLVNQQQQEKAEAQIDEKSEEHGSVLKDLKDKQKEVAAKPPVKDVAEKAAKAKGGEAL